MYFFIEIMIFFSILYPEFSICYLHWGKRFLSYHYNQKITKQPTSTHATPQTPTTLLADAVAIGVGLVVDEGEMIVDGGEMIVDGDERIVDGDEMTLVSVV